MRRLYVVTVDGRPVFAHTDRERASDIAQRIANQWRGAVVRFVYPGGHTVTQCVVLGPA